MRLIRVIGSAPGFERSSLASETGPGEVEEPLAPILEARGLDGEPVPVAHQDAQLGVGSLQEREAYEGSVADQLRDSGDVQQRIP